jgi:hypothetical protein
MGKVATTAGATTPAMAARRKATPKLRVVKGGRSSERDTSIRWDRVRNARARITAGYYDRPDVRERVLAAVLDEIDDS